MGKEGTNGEVVPQRKFSDVCAYESTSMLDVWLLDQLSLPSLRGRQMNTSFGWEGKGRYGSFR